MFFKKKESQSTAPPQATRSTTDSAPRTTPTEAPTISEGGKPVYQKPVLRRYDQIDQVKPYGPSEI